MSDRRPLIGLTGRRKKVGQIEGFPDNTADLDADVFLCDYSRAIDAAGGLPVLLPIDVDATQYVERLDGLLLSGGADIEPARFGAASETDLYPPEPERDAFEFAVLERAVAERLPTLGICRGLQLINVHAGGTLHQHVPEHAAYHRSTTDHHHEVVMEPDSVLGAMYGGRLGVNSLHHQTIDRLGDGLRATARSSDGVIEGIEDDSLTVLAVQWHPEMMVGAVTDPLFGWLIDAAAQRY